MEVGAHDPLIVQFYLCLAVVFGFSSLFTAVYNTIYSVGRILKIIKRHAYTERIKLARKLKIARIQFLVPAVLGLSFDKESQTIFWVMSPGRRLPYQGLQSMKCILQKKLIFHKTMLMQMSDFLSYQKTKFADQLFNCEFNTEKSDSSIAIAVKAVSDSCAAAVCLT